MSAKPAAAKKAKADKAKPEKKSPLAKKALSRDVSKEPRGEPEAKVTDSSSKLPAADTSSSGKDIPASVSMRPKVDFTDPTMLPFEAGQIFSKFDYDNDGKLDKREFTELIRQNPDLLRGLPARSTMTVPMGYLPTEVISHRILTHFDETAGVAIPRIEVEQHIRMGNIITPLTDAYKARYERLRSVMTGKLLPKREHLLQLRRNLQHTSAEVDAKRRGIERETLTDTEQILERLRGVESMRQSSIRHQVLQLEEELQSIERLVRRVERANIEEVSVHAGGSSSILLTSAHPSPAVIEPVRAPRATAMVEMIHEFGDLMSLMEQVSMKSITVQTDFPTDDFPRETAERLEIIGRCDRYTHALSVKDHMLWTALQEKDKAERNLIEEKRLSQEYALEVSHWAELTQQQNQQLNEERREKDLLQRRIHDLINVLRSHNIYYEGY